MDWDEPLKFFPIFQNYNNHPSYFYEALGKDHGRQAAVRARELGIGPTPIFFAVDYDATGEEANSIVTDYFNGIREGLKASLDVKYEIGVYGTRNVCSILADAGKADAVWVSGMSTGYSGNLGFPMPDDWWYNQIKEITSPSLDRNAVSVRAEPLTSTLSVPLKAGDFHPLYWGKKIGYPTADGMMKLQVLAEKHLEAHGGDDPMTASRIVLYWLQSARYATTAWQAYTPGFPVLGAPLIVVQRNQAALADFASELGSIELDSNGEISSFTSIYEDGELDHAAATSHGVLMWGAHAGSSTTGKGDLGGWALDLVQLWERYCFHGKPGGSVGNWVNGYLGELLAGTGRFDRYDLRADADGWLVGTHLRKDRNWGEAWRRVLVDNATPDGRLAAFVVGRFGSSPRSGIQSCVEHLFATDAVDIAVPRDMFLDGQPSPSTTEREELAEAVADKLVSLANL